jgi:hypothetical protein
MRLTPAGRLSVKYCGGGVDVVCAVASKPEVIMAITTIGI